MRTSAGRAERQGGNAGLGVMGAREARRRLEWSMSPDAAPGGSLQPSALRLGISAPRAVEPLRVAVGLTGLISGDRESEAEAVPSTALVYRCLRSVPFGNSRR